MVVYELHSICCDFFFDRSQHVFFFNVYCCILWQEHLPPLFLYWNERLLCSHLQFVFIFLLIYLCLAISSFWAFYYHVHCLLSKWRGINTHLICVYLYGWRQRWWQAKRWFWLSVNKKPKVNLSGDNFESLRIVVKTSKVYFSQNKIRP